MTATDHEPRPAPAPGRAALAPLLYVPLFALLFAAFFPDAIIHRDAFQVFAPYKSLIATALRRGEIWAWQPWVFLGMPFVAEPQSGWFYPLNLFYLALPFRAAHNLFILVHYPVAAAGLHLFLRGRGRSETAAALGALAFSLSGYLVSQHATVTMLIGPALTPWVLLFYDRALHGRLIAAVGAGAVLALMVFVGDLQGVAVTAAGLGAWAALAATRSRPEATRAAMALATAGVSALLLSAVQLLPTLELLRLSSRGGGLPLRQAQLFYFHPWRIAELVWPNAFGTNWPVMTWWGQFFGLEGLEGITGAGWSTSNYLGLPAAALALVALLGRPRRERLALAAVGLFCLVLALGPHAPLYALCHRFFPLFNSFRYPEKFLAWTSLAAAVLAAFGLDDLIAAMRAAPKTFARALPLALASIVALLALSALWWPTPLATVPGPVREFALGNLWSGAAHLLTVAAACAALAAIAALAPRFRPMAGVAFLVIVVADLWSTNVLIMPRGPGNIWDSPPLAEKFLGAVGHSRFYRLDMNFRDRGNPPPGQPRMDRSRAWDRDSLAANLNEMEFRATPAGNNPVEFASDRGLIFDGVPPWLLPLLGVEHVITNSGAALPAGLDGATVAADPAHDFTVFRLRRFLPRAFFVGRAVPADTERWPAQLRYGTPYQTVYVEGLPASEGGVLEAPPVEFVVDEADAVEVKVTAPAAGWLVLLDRFYPGWEATVDGGETRVWRANGMVRAVRVPAGDHRVRFDYRPRALYAGAAVSAAAWLAAVIGLTVALKRKR